MVSARVPDLDPRAQQPLSLPAGLSKCRVLSLLLPFGSRGLHWGPILHSCLGLEDSGIGCEFGLLTNPLPGFQEVVPAAAGSSGAAEHHPAGGPAPALETAERAGEAHGWVLPRAAQGRSQAALPATLAKSRQCPPSKCSRMRTEASETIAGGAPSVPLCLARVAWGLQEAVTFLHACPLPGPDSPLLAGGASHPLQASLGVFPSCPVTPI